MSRPELTHGGTRFICLPKQDLPSEIGALFADMDADEQARFWDAVAAATTRWSGQPEAQWLAMVERLKPAARSVVSDICQHVNAPAE